MLSFSGRTKIYAATKPVDLRKHFDSLYAYCRDVLEEDPLSGHAFLFINRARNRIKCLYWDGSGLILICKRLEKYRFTRLNRLLGETIEMTSSEFSLFLEGANLSKRFVESPQKLIFSLSKRMEKRC